MEIYAAENIPTIAIAGSYAGGGNVVCTGESCAQIFGGMATPEDDYTESQGPEVDLVVDKTPFCAALKQSKPSNCTMQIPSTPIFPSGVFGASPYVNNGRGDSKLRQKFIDAALALTGSTGNHDEPVSGWSFATACSAHDWRYGIEDDKAACDNAFHHALLNTRNSQGMTCESDPTNTCKAAAGACLNAVHWFGDDAYAKSLTANACARWHFNMIASDCPRQ